MASSCRSPESVFHAALPYGITAVGVSVAGVAVVLVSSTTVSLIAGSALALLGTALFYGVVSCGVGSSNANAFRKNVGEHTVVAMGVVLTKIAFIVAHDVIVNLIQSQSERRK